ncbi:MAG: hypothetical protein JRJ45_09910, partial [Deltaproteobacteria bacterium]|nr:hypothetical protein [Deltaproteobacteria bacterium]
FSMNFHLLIDSNRRLLSQKITDLLSIKRDDFFDHNQVSKLYEYWEWQERQCKYVINGQRSYDFFGLKWCIPLWADEYLDFWSKLDYRHKFRQGLYRIYLDHFDFYGLFRRFKPVVWNWQGASMSVLPIAALLKKIFGKEISDRFYHYAGYFGKYQPHYAPFGFGHWLRNARRLKSPIGLYIDHFIKEEGLAFTPAG